ncbi:MAG: hypothetical protein U1F63_08965 [Chitinivorax sp.]
MRKFVLLISLLPVCASADFFKCVRDGGITYQQTRCGADAAGVTSKLELPNSMAGCYLPVVPDSPSGWYEIRRVADPAAQKRQWPDDDSDGDQTAADAGSLWLFRSNRPAGTGSPLRAASQEEVRTAAQAFQLDLRQGVTFRESQRNPASYVVPGIYRGKAGGEDIYYIFFEAEKGPSKKVVCR